MHGSSRRHECGGVKWGHGWTGLAEWRGCPKPTCHFLQRTAPENMCKTLQRPEICPFPPPPLPPFLPPFPGGKLLLSSEGGQAAPWDFLCGCQTLSGTAQGKAHREDELQLVEGPKDEEDHKETWKRGGQAGLEGSWLTCDRTEKLLGRKESGKTDESCLDVSKHTFLT